MRRLSTISVLFITALFAHAKAEVETLRGGRYATPEAAAKVQLYLGAKTSVYSNIIGSQFGYLPTSIAKLLISNPPEWNTCNFASLSGVNTYAPQRSGYPPIFG